MGPGNGVEKCYGYEAVKQMTEMKPVRLQFSAFLFVSFFRLDCALSRKIHIILKRRISFIKSKFVNKRQRTVSPR